MIRLKDCLLAACLLSPLTQAADLGTWGDLWPVREQDMLQLITQRLQSLQSSGQWDQTMDAFKQRVIENSQRPAPVEGIKRAEKYEQRWFDPSIRLNEDLKDNEGRVFARKGEVVNPLKTVPFVQTLYFINGDDADQLAWMKRQVPETLMSKIILVRGSIPDTSAALDIDEMTCELDALSALRQTNRDSYRRQLYLFDCLSLMVWAGMEGAEDTTRQKIDAFRLVLRESTEE